MRFQSTHPMRGATGGPKCGISTSEAFQSTHPMRGATDRRGGALALVRHFNPRTPCGVRQLSLGRKDIMWRISIHAPHAGCDGARSARRPGILHFNPRTPCGVRHLYGMCGDGWYVISIHAPHAGCDEGFYCGYVRIKPFQSTHPMRGATRVK